MNTADRSVEALDTALRRRFSFEEMLPKPELLKQAIKKGVSLEDILVCINERIEALIDRDHTIGHSYLFNVKSMDDLKLAFKDKIIPLLQEYFYGDYGKIGLVLGGGFVKMHPQENEIFADFEYDGREGLAQNKFELKTFKDNEEFKAAIKTLLKK
jgi:5-methylcytosine-specific restriction protein B